jgi:hypothetical protein
MRRGEKEENTRVGLHGALLRQTHLLSEHARHPLRLSRKAIASGLFNSPFREYLFVLRRVRHTKP